MLDMKNMDDGNYDLDESDDKEDDENNCKRGDDNIHNVHRLFRIIDNIVNYIQEIPLRLNTHKHNTYVDKSIHKSSLIQSQCW